MHSAQWQRLAVGDEIPIGRGGGFPVQAIEPYRSLDLGGFAGDVEWSWEFQLRPQAGGGALFRVAQPRVDTQHVAAHGDVLLIAPAGRLP